MKYTKDVRNDVPKLKTCIPGAGRAGKSQARKGDIVTSFPAHKKPTKITLKLLLPLNLSPFGGTSTFFSPNLETVYKYLKSTNLYLRR